MASEKPGPYFWGLPKPTARLMALVEPPHFFSCCLQFEDWLNGRSQNWQTNGFESKEKNVA